MGSHLVFFINEYLRQINHYIWSYFLIFFILFGGIYLTIKFKFPQKKILGSLFFQPKNNSNSTRILLASLSASIGPANIIWIAESILETGPIMIPFIWLGAFLGSIIKYSEIFLAIKNREKKNNVYEGGSYFIIKKYSPKRITNMLSGIVLICTLIYSVEVFQFGTLLCFLENTFQLNSTLKLIASITIGASIFLCSSNVKKIVKISAFFVPIFLFFYFFGGSYIIYQCVSKYGVREIFSVNGPVTIQSVLFGIYAGLSSSFYSSDVCLGIDPMVQAESSESKPGDQAYISSMGPFFDSIICTFSSLLILTSIKILPSPMNGFAHVNYLFKTFFPFGEIIFFVLSAVASYTIVASYSSIGQKLAKKSGKLKIFYYLITMIMFIISSLVPLEFLKQFVSILGAILVFINLSVIFWRRDDIEF